MSSAAQFSNFVNRPSNRIYAMNGKSVEVDNTGAEGRLVLAGVYRFQLIIVGNSETCSKMHCIMLQPSSSHIQ